MFVEDKWNAAIHISIHALDLEGIGDPRVDHAYQDLFSGFEHEFRFKGSTVGRPALFGSNRHS